MNMDVKVCFVCSPKQFLDCRETILICFVFHTDSTDFNEKYLFKYFWVNFVPLLDLLYWGEREDWTQTHNSLSC